MKMESMSAFAIYKNNKSTNQAKKQKKRTKSKVQTTTLKLSSKINNLDDISKEIAHKVKWNQNNNKTSKGIMKKKQQKKKKSKLNAAKSKKPIVKKKHNREEIPVLVHVPAPSAFEESETEVEDPYSKSVLSNGNGTVYCSDDATLESNASIDFDPVETDSVEEGLKVFKWMIAPCEPDEFFNAIWEKKPFHITRKRPEYYKKIISTPAIDNMLRTENIQYGKNLDITSYVNGERETQNPEGRAHPHLVWDYYLNGCSIRLLNPQTFLPQLHLLNATLQEYFHSFVGANAYLTPPDSQGFAPHYDDIEAFILQAEGKKHWRIYEPLTPNDILPRSSSRNFDQSEIGKPILEITLEAGDMLYFPRGYIHQGVTIDGEHSLHVTVSMCQRHSWADLFEKMLSNALHNAVMQNVEFRQGLPFNIYDYFGLVHSDSKAPTRNRIKITIASLFDKIKDHLNLDDGVDQMHKIFQHAALPPVLKDNEKAVTVFGDSDVMVNNGRVINRVEIGLETKIRLLRKNILRMVLEEKIRLYYHVENSLEYHGNELVFLEIEDDIAPAIEMLINSYPEYVSVESLELSSDSDKLDIAGALWGRGLIMTEYPLENVDD